MNCKPGDLAYVTWALPENQDCVGRVVNVLEWLSDFDQWHVEFAGERPLSLAMFRRVLAVDGQLRPISGVPVEDETPIETNLPEALQLALGIQARVWA